MVEFAKLEFGIPPSVKVIESAPASPTIFKPAPDEDAIVKVSIELSAITLTPFTDIVANVFVAVTEVK